MSPAVLYRVVFGERNPPQAIRDLLTIKPALLHSFSRHRVQNVDYPGITPEEGKSVLGVYVTGLTDLWIHRLDLFEGDQYSREKVKVRLLEGIKVMELGGKEGEEVAAETYIFKDKKELEDAEWDFEHFVKEKMWRWVGNSEEYEGELRV
jgi:hypothetical protein